MERHMQSWSMLFFPETLDLQNREKTNMLVPE
jgi:hypothetical protein